MTEMMRGSLEGVKSLYGLPTELHKIKILIDDFVFAEFEVTPQQGGMFTTIVENYLEDPDWHKW